MRLEHINMVVRDIDRSIEFYSAAFPHWNIRASGDGDWYGVPRHWVHFGDDYQYLVFNSPGTGENRDLTSFTIGLMHFAFAVDNLDALIGRLEKAGYKISKGGADHAYRKNVYFIDPDGFEVEFVEYLSDIPAERNSDE